MKKTVIPILLLLFSITCYGQKSSEVEIKGTIANNSAAAIAIGDSVCKLTTAGTFNYKVATDKPQSLTVKYQDKQFKIFMEPNEKMEISFDAKDIDKTIKYLCNSPVSSGV